MRDEFKLNDSKMARKRFTTAIQPVKSRFGNLHAFAHVCHVRERERERGRKGEAVMLVVLFEQSIWKMIVQTMRRAVR